MNKHDYWEEGIDLNILGQYYDCVYYNKIRTLILLELIGTNNMIMISARADRTCYTPQLFRILPDHFSFDLTQKGKTVRKVLLKLIRGY